MKKGLKFSFSPKYPFVPKLLIVQTDYLANTCTHLWGDMAEDCDCPELGHASERVQKLERNGHARLEVGIVDLSFLSG